jgi:sRNA-binding protein
MPHSPNSLSKRARHQAWHAVRVATLLLFRQKFPQTFARLNARSRRPLKIGIHRDLAPAMHDLSKTEIARALRYYVSHINYQQACIEGAERVDLDGNSAGTVTRAAAENAKRTITGIEAKLNRRRAPYTEPPPTSPKRATLADLRAAATARKVLVQGA